MFRGAAADGLGSQPAPVSFHADPETGPPRGIRWKVPLPGLGHSSPVVWGDRVFVTTAIASSPEEAVKKGLYFGGERKAPADEHRYVVYCVDFQTGRILWEKEVHKGVPPGPRHLKNSFASETPVTDGQMVYAYFGNVGVFALDMAGKLVWEKRFPPVRTRFGWGTAASAALAASTRLSAARSVSLPGLEALAAMSCNSICAA